MKTPKSPSTEPSFPPQLKQHSLVFQLLLLCSSLPGKTNLKLSAKGFLLPRGPLSCVLGGAMAPSPTGARTGRGRRPGRLGATCQESVCHRAETWQCHRLAWALGVSWVRPLRFAPGLRDPGRLRGAVPELVRAVCHSENLFSKESQ